MPCRRGCVAMRVVAFVSSVWSTDCRCLRAFCSAASTAAVRFPRSDGGHEKGLPPSRRLLLLVA